MKLFRFFGVLFLLAMFTGVTLAQTEESKSSQSAQTQATPPAAGFVPIAGMKSKLFEVKHREPNALAETLRGLASPSGSVQFNGQLRALTVRDFPENIALIEDGLKRLDVPEAASANLEITLHLLKGSTSVTDTTTFPASLQPVLKQLQGTLKFQGYQFITTLTNRGLDGNQVEGNGVVANGVSSEEPRKGEEKSFFYYKISRVRAVIDNDGKEVFQLTYFNFGLYSKAFGRDLGFNTSLNLRENEQVVVGTTNLGEEAVIVVVSVKKVK